MYDQLRILAHRQLRRAGGDRGLTTTTLIHEASLKFVDQSQSVVAGLARGDVIQEVNGEAVGSVSQFEQAVRKGAGKPVMLLVNRGGSSLYIAVEPQ